MSRTHTIASLGRLGFSEIEIRALMRASAVLHTWAEHECNGVIQRDEITDRPYWYNAHTGKRMCRTSDRELGAKKRVAAITGAHGYGVYFQGDPRGCPVYIIRPGDVPEGADVDSYYSRGVAVCT